MALEEVGCREAAMKDIQVALGDTNVSKNRHAYELTLIFDKLSVFQEGVIHNIRTITEMVDKIFVSHTKGLVRWRHWWRRYWSLRKTGY